MRYCTVRQIFQLVLFKKTFFFSFSGGGFIVVFLLKQFDLLALRFDDFCIVGVYLYLICLCLTYFDQTVDCLRCIHLFVLLHTSLEKKIVNTFSLSMKTCGISKLILDFVFQIQVWFDDKYGKIFWEEGGGVQFIYQTFVFQSVMQPSGELIFQKYLGSTLRTVISATHKKIYQTDNICKW